jgi:diguanylate cyclase (GGDEF)-like protein
LKSWFSENLRASNRQIVFGLVGALLVCLWCFVGFWSWWERSSIIASNSLVLEQLTAAVQEQTKSLFKQAETLLVASNHWMAEHPDKDPGRNPEFIDLVERLRKASDDLLDIRMVTRNGSLRYIPDRGQTNQTNVADRDYFRAQFDPKTRGYFVGNPLVSRVTGKWGIPISIPVDKAGGDIAVLFAAIELDRIASSFEAERIKPFGTIAIVRLDGTFLFRSPMDTQAIGSSIAQSTSWTQYLSLSSKGGFRSPQSPVDGKERIVSFSHVPDYPLLVTVTTPVDDLLGPWKVHTAILAMVAVIVSILAVLMGSVLLRTMTSEERVRQELEHLMLTDQLTGVGNRRMLTRRLDEEILRAERYGRAMTAVFFDLDFFKQINDTYGHSVGDSVLTRVAQSLASNLRQSDHLGRFGGEEFVVLLPETGIEDALTLVERMRAAIAAIEMPEMHGHITVSAGLAQWASGENGESLLHRSDRALYQAKASGRDRSCVDPGH